MSRVCFFVFFDPEGYVDRYVECLLNNIRCISDHIIVVINGSISNVECIEKKCDEIVLRENIGYDAGAYKDLITGKIGSFSVDKWDEILLMNDSCFGPFFPFDAVFREMKEYPVDFWGLSRHGEYIDDKGRSQPDHLQSYFLLLKRSLFLSDCFYEYWDSMEYPKDKSEAIEIFELTFSKYFRNKGFRYTSLLDTRDYMSREDVEDVTISDFDRIIFEYRFPMLKRTAYNLLTHNRYFECLDRMNMIYDPCYAYENIKRLTNGGYKKDRFGGFWKLRDFVESKNKIFLFGHGRISDKLTNLFAKETWKISGFVVSKSENGDEIALSDFNLEEGDGLIVAVGYAVLNEVKGVLINRFGVDNVLFP